MKAGSVGIASLVLTLVAALAVAPALAQEKNPERNAYFGEEHIHTSWSVDAWVMGNRLTGPGDAYKYAQGETIKHPLGFDIKIDTPLDFMGVTDRSEYVGVTKQANTPGSYVSKLPTLTGVNDADYPPPFTLTAKLNKLTIKVDRPLLSKEDIARLEAAMRNNKLSE